jgi:hypothetical protein
VNDTKQKEGYQPMEHIQIKKPIKIAIICLAALIAAGAVAGASYWAGLKNGAQAQTCQTCPTTVSEKGVAVKCAYKANAADAYGSYEITYTVTPAIYTDQIMAKLAYSDGSEVPDTVATLDHDVSAQKATVHCKAAFTKQVVATIYAASPRPSRRPSRSTSPRRSPSPPGLDRDLRRESPGHHADRHHDRRNQNGRQVGEEPDLRLERELSSAGSRQRLRPHRCEKEGISRLLQNEVVGDRRPLRCRLCLVLLDGVQRQHVPHVKGATTPTTWLRSASDRTALFTRRSTGSW